MMWFKHISYPFFVHNLFAKIRQETVTAEMITLLLWTQLYLYSCTCILGEQKENDHIRNSSWNVCYHHVLSPELVFKYGPEESVHHMAHLNINSEETSTNVIAVVAAMHSAELPNWITHSFLSGVELFF